MSQDIDRRALLKGLGISGGAATGFSGIVSALNESDVAISSVRLSKSEAKKQFGKAMSTAPGRAVNKFVSQRKGTGVERSGISGIKILPEDKPEFVVLTVPLSGDGDSVVLKVFDQTATGTVSIDGELYKSNPKTTSGGVTSDETNAAVVPAEDWAEYSQTADQVTTQGSNCTYSGSFDTGGPACDFLGGIALLAGAVMVVVPEPGSSIAGVFLISSVLGGSCLIADSIDDALGGCNFTRIGVCVKVRCFTDPLVGYWCDYAAEVYPVDGCA